MADNNMNIDILDFGTPEKDHSIIKVVGVGGGGGNAVNHMYREGIHDVTFVLCNTDNQALNDSPVPVHLQLGKEGLGAGNKPEKARMAAEESIEDIKNMLNDGTRMAFITAGMGGGTGTGAAPVIARVSKELGILTVGIVTIPFRFEGDRKIDQALDGVEEMNKHVDALLVINNERLREIYPGRYEAIIMDPPSYGRGPGGEVWKLEDMLWDFVSLCTGVLSDDPLFVLINSYTTGLAPSVLTYITDSLLTAKKGGSSRAEELGLPVSASSLALPCGASCRWEA